MIQFYLSVLLIVIIGLVLFTNKEHFQTCDESNINLNAMNIYDEHSNWSGINLIWDEVIEKDVIEKDVYFSMFEA